MLKRLGLGLLALLFVGVASPAFSQISQGVRVCNPLYPSRCLQPNASGQMPVTGTITANSAAHSTAAAPTYVEDTDNDLSGDLHGSLRATILNAAGSAVDWSLPVDVKGTGTAGTANSGVVTVQGIASMTPVQVSQATASSLNAQVVGPAASGATASGNPLLEGCRAATTSPTAVTDGQAIAAQCGAEGARVIRPYAIKELMVRGSTGAITNTAQTSIIASAGGSLKNYITAIQCANSGSTTSILTFTDAAATVLINPSGGGGSWTFPIPLVTAAATAFQVTPGSSSTSQYCSAQGYTGL